MTALSKYNGKFVAGRKGGGVGKGLKESRKKKIQRPERGRGGASCMTSQGRQ